MVGKLSSHILVAVSYISFKKQRFGVVFKTKIGWMSYSFLLIVFITGKREKVIYLQLIKTEPFPQKMVFFVPN